MRELKMSTRAILLAMSFVFTVPAMSKGRHEQILPKAMTAEAALKMKQIFQTPIFEPVGGTISKRITGSSYASNWDDIVSFTLVCTEKANDNCDKYALFSETSYNNEYLTKLYQLDVIHTTDLEQFSDEQVKHYKAQMSWHLKEKYINNYYFMATEKPFNALFSQPLAMGIILWPLTIVGAAVDVAKSPLVGLAHGAESAVTKISSASTAKKIVSFMSDTSKRGALLDISHENYNQYFHVVAFQGEDKISNSSKEFYEINDKILPRYEFQQYMRRLEGPNNQPSL